jgi:DNA-binding PadR family transcriptional regulator
MSNKQSDSSKKSKPDKIGVKNKVKDFTSQQSMKLSSFTSKVKGRFSAFYHDKIVHQEVYVDGQEPKSYSFQRKFYGLYGIFAIYSLLLITAINIPGSTWINILMFGNPFVFSNTIVAFFLVLSFLLSVDKVRIFIFEEKTAIKQLILYCSLFVVLYLLLLYFSTDLNFMTYLLTLAMIWLLLLSSRFYIYSRKFSTKIEARFIKKYSIPRYFFAIIIPFFILAVLVIISLFYRSFLVFLSLDFFGKVDPTSAVKVYNLEMRVIMPLIYFSLVMTLVFIIFEFVLTRRRAETKRAGTFDNFTFSLIVLFIFFFQILQISIYMLLQDDTVTAFKATIGATGSPASYIYIFEFAISMYFLFRIIRRTGQTIGWRILFFKKDGLILLCLACVFAQTLTRFSLASQINNQTVTDVGIVLMADKYIISVLMIFFLGSTILVYYLKPHETSMFMRLQKETVSEEEEVMERIYKIIRGEYIRRGEAYPIEIIERELIKATQLSKGNVYVLLDQLVKKDMDILIREEKQDLGKPIKMIDFVSVTERFEKKGVAKKKARRYLSERLLETALEKDRKTSRLTADAEAGKTTNSFISSLTSDFSKKQKDKEIRKKKLNEADISFTSEQLTENLKSVIIQIIKKEYIYRLENPRKIPEFYIPISEISHEIELATRITPGELYPILEDLNKNDVEISLVENPDEPEDKRIRILPFADDNMIYSLVNFRPEEYSKFRILVTKAFLKNLKTKKEKRILFQLKKQIPDKTETQKSWIELLSILHKYYPIYLAELEKIPDRPKLRKNLEAMAKFFETK